jgi:hypothetical protein
VTLLPDKAPTPDPRIHLFAIGIDRLRIQDERQEAGWVAFLCSLDAGFMTGAYPIMDEGGHRAWQYHSVEQSVLAFFPSRTVPNLDATQQAMTVEPLLSISWEVMTMCQ